MCAFHPLRDYQEEDVEAIFREWETGARSTLYVAATGLGKTRIMVEVSKRLLPKRTVFLAHREELVMQAWNSYRLHSVGCEIEKAELKAAVGLFNRADVVIASVQTLLSGDEDWRRMHKFDPNDFGLLLYDESHHSVSPGNKKIVDYFLKNPELKVLGVTATPDRADEAALGQIFETVASERDILWGVENGWLVDVEQQFITIEGLDYSHIRTTAGDLNGADLAAVMEAESNVQGVVQPTLEALFRLPESHLSAVPVEQWSNVLQGIPEKRRAIVFTASVAQAERLANIFNRVLPNIAGWVCGKTREEDRRLTMANFKGGDISILVNCGVTTEGYDNPAVDLIVMARPTKSRSLYSQMIGRGTRPLPGILDGKTEAHERVAAIKASAKPSVLVMDFVGNSGRHKLITTADVLGGKMEESALEKAVALLKKKKGGRPMREALKEAEDEIRAAAELARQQEEARRQRLVARSRFVKTRVNAFDALDITPAKERGWDIGKTLTLKQADLLRKQGINPDEMPYTSARQLLNEMFRRWKSKLATYKQCALLKRFGYSDTQNLSMAEATSRINRLAANGWKKPIA